MFNSKYLIRLDDASPFMDSKKWQRMEDVLNNFNVKPLVGIIPVNADSKTMIETENPSFWKKAKAWQRKGWTIALHGYDHCYISDKGMQGLNPMWRRSEFAGVPLAVQCDKIRKGYIKLKAYGLKPEYFFAPSHTFDENTLEALRKETDIRMISDTIGRFPYRKDDFFYLPQIVGHCVKVPMSGIYTFCFHPNKMNEKDFASLEVFLERHKDQFVGFNDILLSEAGHKTLIDRMLSWAFFMYRKVKGLQ